MAKSGFNWKGNISFVDWYSNDTITMDDESLDETVLNIKLCKCKLSDLQLTQLFLNHQFLILETKNWWWSIEKDGEGIVVQRSKREANVLDTRTDGTPRPKPVLRMEHHDIGNIGLSINSIMIFIADEELDVGYHWFYENCKSFAHRLYNAILNSHE